LYVRFDGGTHFLASFGSPAMYSTDPSFSL
jgi:hypothetical protein